MGRPSNDNYPEAEQFRKLFIGGLDYRTTDQSLKSFYEQWGEIVDVVVMKHPQSQKSRGFGFVTYSKSSMVDEAMKNRPHKIDGREVDSKRAVPRDESGVQTNANVNVKKMFVGGLKEQSEEELKSYFGTFGNIISTNIVMDKQTGKRKGYAFIEFDDYDPVDKALLRKDHIIGGKSVTVKKAVVKEGPGSGGSRPSTGRGGGRGGSGGRGTGGSGAWGSQWSGGANGYGGPWDTQAQGNGWNSQWDQYGGGWGANGFSGYSGTSGTGGPIRNSYSGQSRSAPYGGASKFASR